LCRVGTARLCQAGNRMKCQLVSERRWQAAIALTSGTAAGVSVARQRGKSEFGVDLLDDNVRMSAERIGPAHKKRGTKGCRSVNAFEISARANAPLSESKTEGTRIVRLVASSCTSLSVFV
jgi:hypothetical protein